MFGSRELSGLIDTSGLSANAGKKKGEVDSAALHIKKSKFVPKIDLSKQVKIHRRRRKKQSLAASSSNAKNSVLFQEDEDEDDGKERPGFPQEQGEHMKQHGRGEASGEGITSLHLSKEAFLSKPERDDDEIRMDPSKLEQMRKKEDALEDEVAEARRMRMLLQRKQRADSDSDSGSDSDSEANASNKSSVDKDDHRALTEAKEMPKRDSRMIGGAKPGSLAHDGAKAVAPGSESSGNLVVEKKKGRDGASSIASQAGVGAEKDRSDADSSSYSGSGSSDSESSSGDEEEAPQLRFVPKHLRKTIVTEEEAAALEEKREIADREKREVLTEQTRSMVAEQVEARKVAELEEMKKDDEAFIFARAGMPDDTDGVDEEKEYEDWKARELARLKRDLEELHRHDFEQAEIERRRKLTEEERKEEDEQLIKEGKKKSADREKGKMQFMQKYYHKGAFYMDEDTIKKSQAVQAGKLDPRLKDYTGAVERDRRNADVLPEVMQRRGGEFGKKGGTKWTHLTNEDTSNFKDSLFYQGEKERKKKSGGSRR